MIEQHEENMLSGTCFVETVYSYVLWDWRCKCI